ncbi:restriction endonuclease subunit S [Staphylococcus aureus]|uniref:restriction endonuclease subunit S n=2 Tax=Staphylococcus aureus TaxID=1280 RepID=UPI00215B85F3|nr:restriction endonuclease subunit S [Staphylococcus aureus]UVJ12468.1 restriction endonuclease subunit S [Staphylococcus aureus]
MSNTQKKNVPELRFPGFEGEWEEKKLGDLTDRVIRKNKNLESKKPLTISGQLGLIDQTEYFSKSVSSKNLENYTLIKNGEFAYNKSYSNGYPLGAIKRLTRYDSGVLSSLYICFSIKSEMSKDFMEAYFDSTHWYREVSGIAVEGARNHGLLNVSVNDFFTILIKYPSLEEQQKIGKFFSKLDRQIELEEQKLELLQQQKKCYMQKIFSQELRFKDENGNDYPEWENVMLQKVLKDKTEGIKRGPFGGALKKDIFVESGYAVYEQRNAIYDISNFRYYIDENKYNEMISFSVQPNDIIMSCSGTIGRLSLIPQNFTKGIINQALIRFRTNHKIRSEFFLIFMRSNQMQRKILEANPGSAITNLVPVKELKLIPFPLPVKFEQDKISQFILIINRRIEQSEKKIESLKNRKQGFLLKLFV